MKIFKKEKRVVELALEHAAVTSESLKIMAAAIGRFIDGDVAELEAASKRVGRLETEADGLLRQIRELLYSGAYLPTIRGDLYRLLSTVDRVTNHIESCLDFVNYRRPTRVSTFAGQLGPILELTTDCFGHLQEALGAFFTPKGEIDVLRERARNVGELESLIDDRERALTTAIFESELELAEKLHVAELLSRITRISDQVENAGDELELLSLKSII